MTTAFTNSSSSFLKNPEQTDGVYRKERGMGKGGDTFTSIAGITNSVKFSFGCFRGIIYV